MGNNWRSRNLLTKTSDLLLFQEKFSNKRRRLLQIFVLGRSNKIQKLQSCYYFRKISVIDAGGSHIFTLGWATYVLFSRVTKSINTQICLRQLSFLLLFTCFCPSWLWPFSCLEHSILCLCTWHPFAASLHIQACRETYKPTRFVAEVCHALSWDTS